MDVPGKVLTALCLLVGVMIVLSDTYQSTATKVVLGGEWFSSTSTGESGGYLMTDFKTKVFEPIVKRMAQHIYQNYAKVETLEWILGGLGGWLGIMSGAMAYMIKNCKCRQVKKSRREREVAEREEEGRPLRNP